MTARQDIWEGQEGLNNAFTLHPLCIAACSQDGVLLIEIREKAIIISQ